uniref:Cl31697_1 n=1 Tax=Arundo donax TaxID=35708 RepID=A0A0A9EAP4_ARUDO
MWIRIHSVSIDTEMLLFLPNLVLHLAFLFTLWCRISRFASRMLATIMIKVWIALVSYNTILNKVAPCHDRVASIATITTHKTTTCQ